MKIRDFGIKVKLKKLAKDFDLKYKPEIFNYLILPREKITIRDFIGLCLDPYFNKFGIKHKERIKNIGKFLNSKEFRMRKKGMRGCVISKNSLECETRLSEKIKNKKIRSMCLLLYKKIASKMKRLNSLVLIYKPKNKKEKEAFKEILLHEFIHQLLDYNKIVFKGKRLELNEGLATYMEYLSANRKLPLRSKLQKDIHFDLEWWNLYFGNANKWAKILQNKSPRERKQIVLDYCKRAKELK